MKGIMELRYLNANKPKDRIAQKTKAIPKKNREFFDLLGLPLPTQAFWDELHAQSWTQISGQEKSADFF